MPPRRFANKNPKSTKGRADLRANYGAHGAIWGDLARGSARRRKKIAKTRFEPPKLKVLDLQIRKNKKIQGAWIGARICALITARAGRFRATLPAARGGHGKKIGKLNVTLDLS